MPTTSYRPPRKRSTSRAATRERILATVHNLLADGAFHAATMEEVAERAGVSRATLYLHFGSRAELVDAICDVFAENPALIAIRDSVVHEDPGEALSQTLSLSVAFWRSEEAVLAQLYGVAAVDPAAARFVKRQLDDRRSELRRLAANLEASGRLRPGLSAARALGLLLLLTSFGTYLELRRNAGMSLASVRSTLQEEAERLLLAPG